MPLTVTSIIYLLELRITFITLGNRSKTIKKVKKSWDNIPNVWHLPWSASPFGFDSETYSDGHQSFLPIVHFRASYRAPNRCTGILRPPLWSHKSYASFPNRMFFWLPSTSLNCFWNGSQGPWIESEEFYCCSLLLIVLLCNFELIKLDPGYCDCVDRLTISHPVLCERYICARSQRTARLMPGFCGMESGQMVHFVLWLWIIPS
jgi:hypothetical protein